MMWKITSLMLIVFLLLSPSIVKAEQWEDENTPLSYRIELLPWEEVDELLPRKTKFTIIDVETGLHFNVQRRAGNKHADVQPLTTKDTKIMKKIYGGEWSWKRRAIIVLADDKMIAASMNGMPHGAGALQNGFPGHFCVHFFGSSTHRSKKEDLGHKLMMLKSAGKLDNYIHQVDPYELLDVFAVAVNQGDSSLLQMITTDTACKSCLNKVTKTMSYFLITDTPEKPKDNFNGLLLVQIPATISYIDKMEGNRKRNIQFIIRRDFLTNRWLLEQDALYDSLK
ncbi:hypothetical protein OEV98_06730 [Caldibacillus lycopersici]|uniref:Uncharacterized protein n=1 Tax=Perspicuibacillus lycopersici TaxID=1325689 RepID=A0AAE3IRQ6_9BACI|nr:hypothetical protein [Perspicuibacillus lycopersici]MCU9613246.1 hypothetical protein [Perspicuibacillus lycopersici]